MCKLNSFTIYIQSLTLTALAILSTLVVGGVALYCVVPTWLWLWLFSTGHPGPYISPLLKTCKELHDAYMLIRIRPCIYTPWPMSLNARQLKKGTWPTIKYQGVNLSPKLYWYIMQPRVLPITRRFLHRMVSSRQLRIGCMTPVYLASIWVMNLKLPGL